MVMSRQSEVRTINFPPTRRRTLCAILDMNHDALVGEYNTTMYKRLQHLTAIEIDKPQSQREIKISLHTLGH
jgi:hypothetical protein